MRFTTTIGAYKDEPALWILREMIGFFPCLTDRGMDAREARVEIVKVLIVKRAQVGEFDELLTPFLFALGLFTLAGNGFAKIGMTKRHVGAAETGPFTFGASGLCAHLHAGGRRCQRLTCDELARRFLHVKRRGRCGRA